ncbi:hypothetical protein [Streptomyces sp. DH12]|uniref:hypothetical protein n=1 Tax=Streptomyces sp. DH12 TaxID=2857010 RepID=UPI001E41F3E5|nr:hypothetical protein [Streptomyces sp. DH12]
MGNRCTLRWENAVVKKHGKKQRAKKRAARTGAGHASAAAGTTHEHTPLPDMAILKELPHRAGRELDLDLAARLVAACRTACKPCQKTLARKLRTEQRPTLTVLAAAVYGLLPTAGAFASPTTRSWAPLARAGKSDPAAAAEALAAVEAMNDASACDLLEDALDHWAAGGASPEQLADMFKIITSDDLGMSPEDVAAAVDPQTQVSLYADRAAGAEGSGGLVGSAYRLHLGYIEMADGRPLPLIAFEPRGEQAGLEHLRTECRWQAWDGRGSAFPELDFNWRIRTRIASQALEEIAHTDREGFDDIRLWRGEAKLPDDWWDLLDVASHALLCGPVSSPDPDALLAAAARGELVAVVARARFW